MTKKTSIYLLSNGRHQISTAVAESRYRSLLLFLVQHFKLILSERLTRLWNHFDHIQNQDLEQIQSGVLPDGTET